MPYTAGGRWVPAPGQSYMPPRYPGGVPMVMPDATPAYTPPVASQTPSRVITGDEWVRSTLDGPRILNVGGTRFRVPRDSQVKAVRRAGVVWLRTGGKTYILSESGLLNQSDEERAATRWDLL